MTDFTNSKEFMLTLEDNTTYVLEKKIGSGSFGDIYLGTNSQYTTILIIKANASVETAANIFK